MRAALARFLTLPVSQRSAVILKDVLGHSLEETAETMGSTVMAVKAALVRGRAKLCAAQPESPAPSDATRAELARFAFAAFEAGAAEPSYFVLVELEAGRVRAIRDFRYVPYMVTEAEYELVE